MDKPLILVVEDDKAVKNLITTTLDIEGYRYHTASRGQEALVEAVSPDTGSHAPGPGSSGHGRHGDHQEGEELV